MAMFVAESPGELAGVERFGTDVHGKTLGLVGFGRIGAGDGAHSRRRPGRLRAGAAVAGVALATHAECGGLPHIGSTTHETRTAMAERAVDNLLLALRGERPINPVNENARRGA